MLTCQYKICYKLMLTYSTVHAILFFLFSSQNVVQLRERYQAVADHVSNNKNRFLQLLKCQENDFVFDRKKRMNNNNSLE
jgi:hypothetical protein